MTPLTNYDMEVSGHFATENYTQRLDLVQKCSLVLSKFWTKTC